MLLKGPVDGCNRTPGRGGREDSGNGVTDFGVEGSKIAWIAFGPRSGAPPAGEKLFRISAPPGLRTAADGVQRVAQRTIHCRNPLRTSHLSTRTTGLRIRWSGFLRVDRRVSAHARAGQRGAVGPHGTSLANRPALNWTNLSTLTCPRFASQINRVGPDVPLVGM